jgi:hypothetical protein
MATKSTRSSGTQINARGITQGNTLVGAHSGLPIDEVVDSGGVRRLAVDATIKIDTVQVAVDLDVVTDGVHIGDLNTGYTLTVEPDGSINVNSEIDAADGDNIAISDGTNTLAINPDGSINVVTTIGGLTSPTITNITATLANTEYSYAFPVNTKKFSLQTRGMAKIQLAFIASQTNINYLTISPGVRYGEDGLTLSSTTVYFRLSKPGEVVEILSWV